MPSDVGTTVRSTWWTWSGRLAGLLDGFDEVLAPLAVGEPAHVDHRLVRQAAAAAWRPRRPRRRPALRLYEDAPYIGRDVRDAVSATAGLRLAESAIDLEAKLTLVRGYASQPIESWEPLIRRTAGDPPAERTWSVDKPEALDDLE